MTIKRIPCTIVLFLLLFAGAADIRGQFKDFQTWWEMELNKELTGKLDLNGELEQRFRNNSLQYASTLLTIGASYDLLDYLRIGGGARTVFRMDASQDLNAGYRLHMDVMGKYRLSGFDLSLRARFQYGFDDLPALGNFRFHSIVNRYRLKIADHIFGTKFDWFATVESWHGSVKQSRWMTYGIRYSAGARYSPDFRSVFMLRFILEDEFNIPQPEQLYILVMGYSYTF